MAAEPQHHAAAANADDVLNLGRAVHYPPRWS